MQKERYMETDIYRDVSRKLKEVLGEEFQNINTKDLIDYAVDNIYAESKIAENEYYDLSDINLAVQRSIAHHLYKSEMRSTNINSLTESILAETTDYENLDLSANESKIIFERTENIYDKDDVELIINKSLLEFGYEFDPNYFMWLK